MTSLLVCLSTCLLEYQNASLIISESLVDIEYKATLSGFAESIVEAYVYVLLEFPAVAQSVVGQNVAHAHLRELRKYGSGSSPKHDTVASPYMLAQLYLCLNFVFVAIAALVVASHLVAVAKQRHHCPRWIAKVEQRAEVGSKGCSLPQGYVSACVQVGCTEGILVAHKSGSK